MASFKLYLDAAQTVEFTGPLQVVHNSDLSDNPQDFQFFLGSNTAGVQVEANSNPGIDNISISVADSAPGADHEATEILLSTTQIGLDSATPGAALSVGTSILSESANNFEFWLRVVNAVTDIGVSTELSISTNVLVETAQ